jgi:hypothetical protein
MFGFVFANIVAGTLWMLSRPECKRTLRSNPAFDKHPADEHRQLQTGAGAGGESYNGMIDCFRKIIKNEG